MPHLNAVEMFLRVDAFLQDQNLAPVATRIFVLRSSIVTSVGFDLFSFGRTALDV